MAIKVPGNVTFSLKESQTLNHPDSNQIAAMIKTKPALKKRGETDVRLQGWYDVPL